MVFVTIRPIESDEQEATTVPNARFWLFRSDSFFARQFETLELAKAYAQQNGFDIREGK